MQNGTVSYYGVFCTRRTDQVTVARASFFRGYLTGEIRDT